jgi:ATP-dependent HslUV protease ATP-binding subunit HslU
MVKEEEKTKVMAKADDMAEERILDLLLPRKKSKGVETSEGNDTAVETPEDTREKLRSLLKAGKLEDRMVELEVSNAPSIPMVEVVSGANLDEIGMNLRDMFQNLMPRGSKRRKMKVAEARQVLIQEEAARLIDMDQVTKIAVERVEQNGIVFLDEIDKIAGREGGQGPDVSREGVQRDILPIVEGSNVNTKYGMVKTDHILFIAAGAFHVSKPSDLIPELQGRFPIRVELDSLTKDDFLKILVEPENSLSKQYVALLATEDVNLEFKDEGLQEMASFAAQVNENTENIGARRLHTIMERVLEDVSFKAPEMTGEKVSIDAAYVRERLANVTKDQDLSRYIL